MSHKWIKYGFSALNHSDVCIVHSMSVLVALFIYHTGNYIKIIFIYQSFILLDRTKGNIFRRKCDLLLLLSVRCE